MNKQNNIYVVYGSQGWINFMIKIQMKIRSIRKILFLNALIFYTSLTSSWRRKDLKGAGWPRRRMMTKSAAEESLKFWLVCGFWASSRESRGSWSRTDLNNIQKNSTAKYHRPKKLSKDKELTSLWASVERESLSRTDLNKKVRIDKKRFPPRRNIIDLKSCPKIKN